MTFEEKKAIEIIEKFNLSQKTLKVWRTRGSIPDKYENAEPQKVYDFVKDCANLREILSHDVINKSFFDEKFGYNYATSDFAKGQIGIREDVYSAIKNLIEDLKTLLERVLITDINKRNFNQPFKELIKISYIKKFVLLGKEFDKNETKLLLYHVAQNNELDTRDIAKMKKAIREFYQIVSKII